MKVQGYDRIKKPISKYKYKTIYSRDVLKDGVLVAEVEVERCPNGRWKAWVHGTGDASHVSLNLWSEYGESLRDFTTKLRTITIALLSAVPVARTGRWERTIIC